MADYPLGKADWLANGLPTEGSEAGAVRAGTLARRDVPTCGPDERAGTVRARLAAAWEACAVVDAAGVVLGLVRAGALEAEPDALVEALLDPAPKTFRLDATPAAMAEFLAEHGLDAALVTTSDGRLVGLVRRGDAERAAADE